LGSTTIVRRHPTDDLLDGDRNRVTPAASICRSAARVNLRPSLTRSSFDSGWRTSRVAFIPTSCSALNAAVAFLPSRGDRVGVVVVVEQVLGRHPERAQQHRRMELPPPIDADVEDVARIELEVDPRAAVRDDARRVEQLPARVGLALVVIEEDARRAVQLETMTRSVPFTMNVPCSVMSGISPK
jgi:hypothetical protein